jgi:hypothetical protein
MTAKGGSGPAILPGPILAPLIFRGWADGPMLNTK